MKYITPEYNIEALATEDIMSVSVSQNGDTTDVSMSYNELFDSIFGNK